MLISQDSHCALIIVIELSTNHETSGVSLEQIAQNHNIPVEHLTPVAERLCAAGIIWCEKIASDAVCWFLRRQPQEIFAYEIIQIFDSELFCGKFMDESTGKWFHESSASRLINYERKHYLNYLRGKLRKINIKRWCEILERQHDSYY